MTALNIVKPKLVSVIGHSAESSTIVVNISSSKVEFDIATVAGQPVQRYSLGPREYTEIPTNYAIPVQAVDSKSDPRASTVDLLTGGRVLAVSDKRAEPIARQLGLLPDDIKVDDVKVTTKGEKGSK